MMKSSYRNESITMKFIIFSLLIFCNVTLLHADITKTVGATGSDFATLKQAFDAINLNSAGLYSGVVTLQIKDNTTETATASLNASSGYTSVIIYPIVSGKSISGSIASAPLIDLNNAESVIIDGRLNATGAIPDLTISNTSTSSNAGTSTIRFINGAVNNVIKYSNILGAETNASSGVVFFSTSTSALGNSNNTIANNKISSVSSTNRPTNAIFSSGTATKDNTGLIINANIIFDFFRASATSYGVNLSSNTTACSIIDNSFYETTSFATTTTSSYSLIYLNNPSGTGFVVSGNVMGGSTLGNNGKFTKTGNNNNFYAINVNVGTGTVTSIQNNVIKSISWTNSGAADFVGINITSGTVNIGADLGNVIGTANGIGSIIVSAGSTGANMYGIYVSSTATVDCKNNTIAAFTTNNASTFASNFYGIYKSASVGNMYITNNVIGDEATLNSIHAASASTSFSQYVYGIYSAGTATVTIMNNKVANLTNSSTNTSSGSIIGIASTNGTNNISNNAIHNLTALNGNAANTSAASVMGISISGSATQRTVNGNKIYNLYSLHTGVSNVVVTGLYFSAGNTSNAVSQNFIYNLVNQATGASAKIYGVRIVSGSTLYSNNIITLNGNTATTIYGIYETGGAGSTNSLYYNTIYIAGNLPSGVTNPSYCLYSASTNNIRNIKNNLFFNARSTTSGANLHFPMYVVSTGGTYAIDYNDYWATGTGSVLAYFGGNRITLAALQTTTAQNSNSVVVNPGFANVSGTLPSDFMPSSLILLGSTTTGVASDYTGAGRLATPTMGAFEIGAMFTNVDVYKAGVFQAGYNTLRGAFSAINAGSHTGNLELKINSSTTEAATAILNASGTGSANYTSVLVYPTISGLSIIGNVATPLIDLSGADNVTIDGRVGATGDVPDLVINNQSTSNTAGTCTIRFLNDATNNTIKYCSILGAETRTTSGVVFFSTTTGSTGNDNNTISNNNISASTNANRPVNAIYSSGTTAKDNSGITISNNNIYDCFNRGIASNGVLLTTSTTTSTVTNNRFYETTLFNPTASVAYNAISISNTSGNGFVITDNVIGGSSSNNDGTFTKAGMNSTFVGVSINVGTATATSVQNNRIQNFSWSNSSSANWTGINISSGNVNVGTSIGNIVGLPAVTNSILLTAAANGANLYGINISSTGTVDCRNNIVAGISSSNAPTLATNIYGINKTATASTVTISNNTVGSNTVANSIFASSSSTASSQYVYGIYSQCTGTATINGNTVANIVNGSTNTNTGTGGTITGIASATALLTMNDNIVHDLTNSNAFSSSGSTGSVIGIMVSGTTALKTLTANTIYNLSNTYTSFTGYITGLYFAGSIGGNTISRNFISGLNVHNASSGARLVGLRISSGLSTYSNNIITISSSAPATVYGIIDAGTSGQNTNLYYNTVYIGGSPSNGNYPSYALLNSSVSAARDYRNNILCNTRSNTGGASGNHYAIYLPSGNTNLTADNNDYFVSGTGSKFGYYGGDVLSFNAWKTSTLRDANSYNINPNFVNAVGSNAADFYPNAIDLIAVAGLGVSTDYANVARSTVPYAGAWEAIVNKWKGTVDTNYSNPANWTANIVPSSNSNIYLHDNPINNAILSADIVIKDFVNAQSFYTLNANGRKITINGSITLSNGANMNLSGSGSSLELAGTVTQNLPSNIFTNNEVYNLIINNSQNVTFSGTIKLLNNLTVLAGKLDGVTNTPTFSYGGTSAQTIASGLFLNNTLSNLKIENTAGVTLTTDFTINTKLTINNGSSLTIPTATFCNVIGNIDNLAGVSGLILKADPLGFTPNASMVYHNDYNSPVQATVEMYSKSNANKAQYIGMPIRTAVFQSSPFVGSRLYSFDENVVGSAGLWTALGTNSVLNAFKGYALMRTSPAVLTFQGELVNHDYNSIHTPFSYSPASSYAGYHLIANPYTAAIDISQIVFGSSDPNIIDNSLLFYNTGSYADWAAAGSGSVSGNAPGQYLTVPVFVAGLNGLPSQIPSMSSVMILTKSSSPDAWVEFPYSAVSVKNSEMMRAKRANEKTCTRIEIVGTKSYDCMWIVIDSTCTHGFDNGWDGIKSVASAGVLQLFAIESDGKSYQVNSVNNIDNIDIAMQASTKDSVYTITFNHQNTDNVYPQLYLLDNVTGKQIDVSVTGTKYTFISKQTASYTNRFKISTKLPSPGIATTLDADSLNDKVKVYARGKELVIDNPSNEDGYVNVYNLSGTLVHRVPYSKNLKTVVELNLPSGPYVAQIITESNKSYESRFLLN